MSLMLALCLVALPVRAQDAAPEVAANVMVIDLAEPSEPISPFVYGANFGPLNVIPLDLAEAAQDSGIRFLRFPGGRVGDQADLQPSQIDAFIAVVRGLGAEPLIHVQLEGGTREAAAEIVRYTNVEQGYGVRYWSIGNEPDLYDADDPGEYTPERHARDWRAIAEAMRAVDPAIEWVGPDISQFTGVAALRAPGFDGIVPGGTPSLAELNSPYLVRVESFLTHFLRVNGDLVSIVSVHRYPFPTSETQTTRAADLYADADHWGAIAARLRAVVIGETARDLPIALTEANSHWSAGIGGEATPDSYANAVWWADVLGQLIAERTFIVGYFNLQTSDRLGGHGLLGRYEIRPTYLTYQLYREFGDTLLPSAAWRNDVGVSGIAARRSADGALTVMMVNRSTQEQSQTLYLSDSLGAFVPGENVQLRQLTRAVTDDETGTIHESSLSLVPNTQMTAFELSMILPPESVSLITLLPASNTP